MLAATGAYGGSEKLTMGWQALAQLTFMVLPLFFNTGYIMRLTALKQMGLPIS